MDSLGEFLAPAASLEHLRLFARIRCSGVGKDIGPCNRKTLIEDKSPTRRLGDRQRYHYYLALYWAEALAAQEEDALKEHLSYCGKLAGDEEMILKELLSVQGSQVDAGGYYLPDDAKAFLACVRVPPSMVSSTRRKEERILGKGYRLLIGLSLGIQSTRLPDQRGRPSCRRS